MATPELRPLGEALGTEALGIDLSKLDDGNFTWIERAFAENPVFVFRNQQLGPKLPIARDRHRTIQPVGHRGVRVDAQEVERRRQDVLGRHGPFGNRCAMPICAAHDAPARHAASRE